MKRRQLSKRESTIRIGGILMFASPFANLLLSVALSTGVPNKWGLSGLKMIFGHTPIFNWFLYASSLVVGSMMMKGRRASWLFVLLVLGIYVMDGGLSLHKDIQAHHWFEVCAMAVNVGLFVLVYLQEFHQQVNGFIDDAMSATATVAASATATVSARPTFAASENLPLPFIEPTPTVAETKTVAVAVADRAPLFNPIPLRVREVSLKLPLLVDLNGVGTWAKLVSISADEIRMESLSWLAPAGIESKMIEIDLPTLPDPVTLRARFVNHSGSTYTFEIIENKFANAA
jgi:hypothetical protein